MLFLCHQKNFHFLFVHYKVTISSCIVLETSTEDASDGTARDTRITSKQAVESLSCISSTQEGQAPIIDITKEHQPSTSAKMEDLIDLEKPPLEPTIIVQGCVTNVPTGIVQNGEYC